MDKVVDEFKRTDLRIIGGKLFKEKEEKRQAAFSDAE